MNHAMALPNVYSVSTTLTVTKTIYRTTVQRRDNIISPDNSTELITKWDWPIANSHLGKRTGEENITSSFTAKIDVPAWHTDP
jgi:hypothetical protein